VKCPLVKGKCWEHKCNWYIQLQGTHPQTGVIIDQWACSMAILPVLMIETNKNVRENTAQQADFRNQVFKTALDRVALGAPGDSARVLEAKRG